MKIRTDFVSNSSSSSFIVATSNNNHTNNAINICSTLGYYSSETEDMFNNNTVLTLFHIDFTLNDEYGNPMLYTSIPGGICISDNTLDYYFDGDEVRKDLDKAKIVRELLWHKFDDNIDIFKGDSKLHNYQYRENDVIVYECRTMGKVNIKTYNFTKWLIEAVKELSQFVDITDDYSNEINADEYLSKIKILLNIGKTLYFTRYSYEGDAEEYGHIYVHDVRSKSISKRLIEAKVISEVL
jgi:hypothetical protein